MTTTPFIKAYLDYVWPEKKLFTEEEILFLMRKQAEALGSQDKLAKLLNVSTTWLQGTLGRRNHVSAGMCLPFGFRRVVMFEQIPEKRK